jgi:hypothetical protein
LPAALQQLQFPVPRARTQAIARRALFAVGILPALLVLWIRRTGAPDMIRERLGPLSAAARHQVLAGGAMGFYALE